MTAARQERKPLVILAALALILLGSAIVPLVAATTERTVTNRYTGLAIDGFDPVAYFVDAAPRQGRAGVEFRSGGVTWQFANEGNRAAFAATPAVYAPRFGGYDPVAVGRGAATPGNPELWLIVRQRLYLFYNNQARTAFANDPDSAIGAAERHWPEIRETLVRD
jgi:hypothetical protein